MLLEGVRLDWRFLVTAGRIIAELLVVESMVDRVQTKAVDPAVKPERRCLEQRRQHLFVS
jgi:hypothetical protein